VKGQSREELGCNYQRIPAVNSPNEKYEYQEWHFIEVAIDIRNI